jgi:N-acetylmuramic acid 6-phosphate etherase
LKSAAKKSKSRNIVLEPATDIRGIATERINPRSENLDQLSSTEIAHIINQEDKSVPVAIEAALPKIAEGIDAIAAAFRNGGRLIYVGTGTSGRLGALDSSECPPTFNADPKMVQYVIAGGDAALGHAVESSEDSPTLGRKDIAQKRPGKKDVVCGLAASGRTPYTVAALEYAREKGAKTICVTANPSSPIMKAADIAIAVDVGPEVVAGSTRMKAGTMQKLVLNMLSTGAFTKVGYVYGNLMVNVHLKNKKLVERGIGIVQRITGIEYEAALKLLEDSVGSVPTALVMHATGENRRDAEKRLRKAGNNLRKAIDENSSKSRTKLST